MDDTSRRHGPPARPLDEMFEGDWYFRVALGADRWGIACEVATRAVVQIGIAVPLGLRFAGAARAADRADGRVGRESGLEWRLQEAA